MTEATCRNCALPIRRTEVAHPWRGTGWTHTGEWQGVRCPQRLTGAEPAEGVIPDDWPRCACNGQAAQMLEHSRYGCAVVPTIMLDAIDANRALTDAERDAIHEAEERRRARGYEGPRLLSWADAVTPKS